MCCGVNERKVRFCPLSNRKASVETWKRYDFLTVIAHKGADSHKHIQVARHQSGWVVMSFLFSFIFILHFHHSFTPRAFSLFACLIVFHHLSPLSCFSSKLPAFLPLSHSHIKPSVSSLRLAVFIFQSFISTNVRQCFCPPSIDPQREEEIKREVGEWEDGGMATKSRAGTERRNEMWGCGLIHTLFSPLSFSISPGMLSPAYFTDLPK